MTNIDNALELTFDYLKKNEELPRAYTFDFDNRTFIGLNTVFSPVIFRDTFFFATQIPITLGGAFLEIGCGTGLISTYAVLNGFDRSLAMDINPEAVKNAKLNALLHDIEHKMTSYVSDIFGAVKPDADNRFDAIFWNVPFINKKEPDSFLEQSVFGDYDIGISKYIAEAKSFLTENGRVFVGFSSTRGEIDLLESICRKNNSHLSLVAHEGIDDIRLELYEVIYT